MYFSIVPVLRSPPQESLKPDQTLLCYIPIFTHNITSRFCLTIWDFREDGKGRENLYVNVKVLQVFP